MTLKSCMLPIAVSVFMAACAGSGPRVMVLPGNGKTLDQFHADDAACRQWAAQQTDTASGLGFDMAYVQCMYAKGNQIPLPGGSQPIYTSQPPATTAPSTVPPPPAGSPPPPPPGTAR